MRFKANKYQEKNENCTFLARHRFATNFVIILIMFVILRLLGVGEFWVAIAIFLAFLLSPKEKEIEIQSGEKKLVTWFLLKEPITLDK